MDLVADRDRTDVSGLDVLPERFDFSPVGEADTGDAAGATSAAGSIAGGSTATTGGAGGPTKAGLAVSGTDVTTCGEGGVVGCCTSCTTMGGMGWLTGCNGAAAGTTTGEERAMSA
jgi:hypothetical protein